MTLGKFKPYFFLLLGALLIPRLVTLFIPILAVDESIYAVFGQEIVHGALPYRDLVDYKSPIIFYLYALAFAIGGDRNMVLVHVFHILITAGTAATLYGIGRFFSGRAVSFCAALLFLMFSASFSSKQFLATNAEPLMIFPLALATYFLFRSLSEKTGKYFFVFLCGFFVSISFLFKYTSGINLATSGLFILLCDVIFPWREAKKIDWGGFFLKGFSMGIGFALPILFLVWYFYQQGAIEDFYFWGWAYNKTYISQGKELLTWDYFLLKFFFRTSAVILAGLLIWVLGFKTLFAFSKTWRKHLEGKTEIKNEDRYGLFIALWFLSSIVPVAMGGRLFYHYYVQLIPPLCLLAAVSFYPLWQKANLRKLLVILTLAPLLLFMMESHSRLLKPRDPTEEKISNHIREHSRPEDKVFVWGYLPQVYFYSARRPASRFVFCQFLTGSTPKTHGMDYDPKSPDTWPSALERVLSEFSQAKPKLQRYDTSEWAVPRAWEDFFSDLEKNRPLYFIDTAPANIDRYGNYPIEQYPKLKAYLEANYQLEITLDDVLIYRRKIDGPVTKF